MRLLIALLLLTPLPAVAQVGALQTDCALGGDQASGFQFVATCAGRAPSPDGRLAIVQRAYDETQPPIELQDGDGKTLATLPSLSDDMPFSVHWAPDSRWFFVNHHVGSFMDVLQIFEIKGETAIERPALVDAAAALAARRYPCLPAEAVLPNGARWTRDGRSVVLVTISRSDACSESSLGPGEWHPLWMIGDARTGRIDPASVRVAQGDAMLVEPRDYAHR